MPKTQISPENIKKQLEIRLSSIGYGAKLTERIRTRTGKKLNGITYRAVVKSDKPIEFGLKVEFDDKRRATVKAINGETRDDIDQIISQMDEIAIHSLQPVL